MSTKSKTEEICRKPGEDWAAYVHRLEETRMRVIAEHKEKEARALRLAADSSEEQREGEEYDAMGEAEINQLRTAARAKMASAEEFRKTIGDIDGNASGGG